MISDIVLELITPKTIITFTDDIQDSARETHALNARPSRPHQSFTSVPLHNAQRIDLSTLAQPPRRSTIDPLGQEFFIRSHRRPERQEKQLRNIEKERAQHEKVQLDRILEELKGPDWLKAMGISGITETEKKLYEPKRAYFIKEVSALINKFKQWKEEEKRRKAERDQAIAEALEEERKRGDSSGDEDDNTNDSDEGEEADIEDEEIADSEDGHDDPGPLSSPTTSSDVDAQAARQLLREATSANRRIAGKPRRYLDNTTNANRPPRASKAKVKTGTKPNLTKVSTRPINSFFPDRTTSLSASPPRATSNHTAPTRRVKRPIASSSTRPVPRTLEEAIPDEFSEVEFDLPSEIRTEKRVRESRRKSRRLRRENGGKSRSVSH